MTVTSNDRGQQNMCYETYAEKAEKLNGRVAMLGFVAGLLSYATTGSLFFFGAFGI